MNLLSLKFETLISYCYFLLVGCSNAYVTQFDLVSKAGLAIKLMQHA